MCDIQNITMRSFVAWQYIGGLFATPAVIMRRSVLNRLKKHYKAKYRYAEDLSLWHELVQENQISQPARAAACVSGSFWSSIILI